MTTLILKLARAPQLPSFAGIAKAFDRFFQAWAEAHAMARVAQQRYPFSIE
jgi:hypothetical protein